MAPPATEGKSGMNLGDIGLVLVNLQKETADLSGNAMGAPGLAFEPFLEMFF
jgi:hypothetical protein